MLKTKLFKTAIITALLLLILSSIAFAGYGRCKRCSCYGFEDDGGMCDCGHSYGVHMP